MPAATSELYARPLIVFLIISAALLIVVNYVPVCMRDADAEAFADMSISYPTNIICARTSTAAFTLENLLTPYPNSILPKDSEITRDEDGIMTKVAFKAYIERLYNEKKLPRDISASDAENKATLAEFITIEEKAMKNIVEEFCYTNERYEYAIRKFVDGVFKANTGSDVTNYDDWLRVVRILAFRVLDLYALIEYIKTVRGEKYGDPAALHEAAALSKRIAALTEKTKELGEPDSAKKLYMKMVEYTTEKNKANANLIALYSGLNLVALGMLFYIYRAS